MEWFGLDPKRRSWKGGQSLEHPKETSAAEVIPEPGITQESPQALQGDLQAWDDP